MLFFLVVLAFFFNLTRPLCQFKCAREFIKRNVSNVHSKDLLNYKFIGLFIQISRDKTRDTG